MRSDVAAIEACDGGDAKWLALTMRGAFLGDLCEHIREALTYAVENPPPRRNRRGPRPQPAPGLPKGRCIP
eukprot:4739898-Lingulodinium_polyedra.AAC.1